jgi:hypothetical protein
MNAKNLTPSPFLRISGNLQKKLETATHREELLSSLKKQRALARCNGERILLHTPEDIAHEFRYSDGQLYFKQLRPGRSIHKPAGHLRYDGYVAVRLKGETYLAHRVVWCLHAGEWPKNQIDHINGVRHDNRIENLREATIQENRRNVTRARNASGVIGVTWARKEGNWRASISINGKAINLGHFENLTEAIACRRAAEKRYGYRQIHQT